MAIGLAGNAMATPDPTWKFLLESFPEDCIAEGWEVTSSVVSIVGWCLWGALLVIDEQGWINQTIERRPFGGD